MTSTPAIGIPQPQYQPFPGPTMANGQPRTLDFPSPIAVPSPYQSGMFAPPVAEFTSAQLPLTRIAEKTDSVMAQGKKGSESIVSF